MNNENPIMFIPLQPKPHPLPPLSVFEWKWRKRMLKTLRLSACEPSVIK